MPRVISALVVAAVACLAGDVALSPAAAQSGPSWPEVEIERMTWIEVHDRIAAGATTVIIPTGGTEQNGRHMVTGKHNLIVRETARRIARRLGDALVAPVLAYVPEGDIAARSGHMAYPGTISVPDAVFAAVLEAASQGFKAHGFRTIVLLGDSGGNQAPQEELAQRLTAAWRSAGVTVLNASRYYADNGAIAWLKGAGEGETESAIGTHAGIRDTSELMAIAPEGVRGDRLAADRDGTSGDPARASRERGERLIELKVAAAVAEIEAARASAAHATGAAPGLLDRLWHLVFG